MSGQDSNKSIIELGTSGRPRPSPPLPNHDPILYESEVPSKPTESSGRLLVLSTGSSVQVKRKKTLRFFESEALMEVGPGQAAGLGFARIDTEETVGVTIYPDDIDIGEIQKVSLSNIHPCVCCKVTLRKGVILLAVLELILWSLGLAGSLVGLLFWLEKEGQTYAFTLGSRAFQASSPAEFMLLRNALIAQVGLCAGISILSVCLLVGAAVKNSKLCLAWLIGIGGLTVGRLVVVCLFPVSFLQYGLLYWILRPYEAWCVWTFTGAVKRLEAHKVKRRKRRRKSTNPHLVPITYYGDLREAAHEEGPAHQNTTN